MLNGIYCIERIETGQKYIGKGKNLISRMNSNHKRCSYIDNALKKYGKKAFIRYPVEYCSIEELDDREKYYIKEWNTKEPNGYNLTDGGGGLNNPSDKTRKLLSNLRKGVPLSDFVKEIMKRNHADFKGEKHPFYGGHQTDEAKDKISKVQIANGNFRFGKKYPNSSSVYHSVFKTTIGKYIYWQVRVSDHGKSIDLGNYNDEIFAAKVYDKYIIENNLTNPLNFPEDYILGEKIEGKTLPGLFIPLKQI